MSLEIKRHHSQRYNIGRHEPAIGIPKHGLADYPWERVSRAEGESQDQVTQGGRSQKKELEAEWPRRQEVKQT